MNVGEAALLVFTMLTKSYLEDVVKHSVCSLQVESLSTVTYSYMYINARKKAKQFLTSYTHVILRTLPRFSGAPQLCYMFNPSGLDIELATFNSPTISPLPQTEQLIQT